jgi:hypothetical protein
VEEVQVVNKVALHIQQSTLYKDPEFVAKIRWMMMMTVHTKQLVSIKIEFDQKIVNKIEN